MQRERSLKQHSFETESSENFFQHMNTSFQATIYKVLTPENKIIHQENIDTFNTFEKIIAAVVKKKNSDI